MAFGRRDDSKYLIVCCEKELLVFDHLTSLRMYCTAYAYNNLLLIGLRITALHVQYIVLAIVHVHCTCHTMYSIYLLFCTYFIVVQWKVRLQCLAMSLDSESERIAVVTGKDERTNYFMYNTVV